MTVITVMMVMETEVMMRAMEMTRRGDKRAPSKQKLLTVSLLTQKKTLLMLSISASHRSLLPLCPLSSVMCLSSSSLVRSMRRSCGTVRDEGRWASVRCLMW